MNPTRGTRTRLATPTNSSVVLAPNTSIASGNPDVMGQTLVLTADSGGLKSSPVSSDGLILIQVDRVYEQARRSVRFGLARFQTVAIDLSQADGVEAKVLRSTLAGVDVAVSWSPRPLPSTLSVAFWSETTTGAGVWAVPPNATELVAATADPGFNWRGGLVDGSAVSTPSPLAVGDTSPVRGPLYVTTGVFTGLWRIQL